MNHLELILENIRLNHINKLLMEAQSEEELQRGVALINESMQLVASNLMEEAQVPGSVGANVPGPVKTGIDPTKAAIIGGSLLGAGAGAVLGHEHGEELAEPLNMTTQLYNTVTTDPKMGEIMIANPIDTIKGVELAHDVLPEVKAIEGASIGAGVGAGAGLGGTLLARRLKR